MQSVGMRWRNDGRAGSRHSIGCTETGEQLTDRKRGSTPRGGLRVSARPRLIRSRSSLGSENAAPEKPNLSGATTAVLGDVTNTTGAAQMPLGTGLTTAGVSNDAISVAKPSLAPEIVHDTCILLSSE